MAYGRVDGTSALKPEDDNAYGDSNFYKSTKPNLTVLEGGKSKNATKVGEASKGLGDAEKDAVSNPIAKTGDGAKNVLNAEAGGLAAGGFINNVRGLKATEKKDVKGKLKKGGPIGSIIALFLGVGGLMLGGQSLMPFSLVAQFIGNFDSINVSTALRSKQFLKFQTNGDIKPATRRGVFGGQKFKLSGKQSNKLKAQGIDSVEIDGKTYLVFDDGSPTRTLISPDGKKLDAVSGRTSVTLDSGETVEIGQKMTFDDAYSKLSDFKNGYNKASRTWKGAVGAWFDNLTLKFLNRIDASRNHFKNFRERVEDAEAGNTRSGEAGRVDPADPEPNTPKTTQEAEMEVAKADMNKGADEVRGTIDFGEINEKQNEAGDIKEETDTKAKEDTSFKTDMDADEIKAKTAKITKAAAAINGAQAGTNVACAIAGVIGTVGVLVAAAEGLQIVKLISSFTEAIQKTQYGEGVDSPIHVLSQSLVTTTNTKSWSLSDDNGGIITETDDSEDYNLTEHTVKENVSAMQSSGIAALYGNTPVDQSDPSVQSFNIQGSFDNILGGLGLSAGAFIGCTAAKLAVAAASAGVTIALLITTGGIGNLIKDAVKGAVVAVGLAAGVTIAIKLLVPKITAALTRDLISDLAGEDLGNALVSGANMYMSGNHRSGGGSLTDKDGLLAYTVEHEKIIADNAEYERANRSPFDITSQYTFLGSLLTKFASFYTASNSTSGFITTIGNITRNSLTSILPSASAVTATKMIEDTGNCPYLESIGAVGDAYCNPYIITDVGSKTMNEHPADIVGTVDSLGGFSDFDENDNPKIDKDSNLGKYILYCSERTSSFGFADQNISNQLTILSVESGSEAVDTTSNAIVGSVPIIGDLVDVVQNANTANNLGWITGESCVTGNTSNSHSTSTPNWANEGEYYQRFLEDQRLMESIDPNYTSAEVAFLEEYYAEHPLDNSYEGILARYSGLTKETVVATLDAIDYLNYIADYDPSTRYVFGDDDTDYTKKTYIDTGSNVAAESENVILQYAIVYNDIRNRTATV
ncbi:hypothetical protein IJI94_02575 [Candidatus Saccharibacteria bacterium]|nr:hypothetical protein [Candidatus Saccharibacteria bacterium]